MLGKIYQAKKSHFSYLENMWPLFFLSLFCFSFNILSYFLAGAKFYHNTLVTSYLGYLIFMDWLVFRVKGKSIIVHSPAGIIAFGFLSLAYWRLFIFFDEISNTWTQSLISRTSILLDAEHQAFERIKNMTYFPSLWIASSLFYFNLKKPKQKLSNFYTFSIFLVGILIICFFLFYQKTLFVLMWISPLLLIDVWNWRMGQFTILGACKERKFKPIISISLGSLITGLFWEASNSIDPYGWNYNFSHLNWFHIFKMPVLGYLGYPMFGMTAVSFLILMKEGLARIDIPLVIRKLGNSKKAP